MDTKKIVSLIGVIVGTKNITSAIRSQLETLVDLVVHQSKQPEPTIMTNSIPEVMPVSESNKIEEEENTINPSQMFPSDAPSEIKVQIEGEDEIRTVHLHPAGVAA
jgi:hypothetical protein